MSTNALTLAAVAAASIAIAPAPAAADDELPAGKIGVSMGVRQGAGQLGEDFGLGAVFGVEAHYHPTSIDRNWSLGAVWSVVRSWYGSDDTASITGSLDALEFNFGLRVRRMMGPGLPRYFVVSSGVSMLRTNVPIVPDNERVYFGPYAAIGVEQYLAGRYLFAFEARYGIIATGPGSFSISLGFYFGA